MSRQKVTKEKLIELYVNDPNTTLQGVADKLGASRAAVMKAMRRYDLKSRNTAGKPKVEIPELSNKAWLEQKFIKEELSATKIGEILGCTKFAVINALNGYNIDTDWRKSQYPQLKDEQWLRQKYIIEGLNTLQIADLIGTTKHSVGKALKRLGISIRGRIADYPQLRDKEWLRKIYIDEKMSVPNLAALVGCTAGAIHSSLIHMGLETRGYKEGWRTKFPEGREGDKHPGWKGGMPHCMDCSKLLGRRDAKRCKSCSSKGELSSNWKGGITEFRKQIRSLPEYFAWRKAIFERDNYACQWPDCMVVSKNIHADHYPDSFAGILNEYDIKTVKEALACEVLWNTDNGRTLCQSHHALTETYGRPKLLRC